MKAHRMMYSIFLSFMYYQIGFSADIFIYNQNMAFIRDHLALELANKGDVSFTVPELPAYTIPTSILIESKDVDIVSCEFMSTPPTQENILESFVGKIIQLVRYGEDGNIASSRDGLLLRTRPVVMFEIDGKIAINPPYSYLFPYIPDDLAENPVLRCRGNASSLKCDMDYSYITPGFDWSAIYSITMDSRQSGNVKGWFLVQNQTREDFENVQLTLVSGDIVFARETGNRPREKANERVLLFSANADASETQPQLARTGDYMTFKLPTRVSLASNRETQFKYLEKQNVPVKRTYKLEHEIGYRNFRNTNIEDAPVTSIYSLMADDLGEYHHPGGIVRIYERSEGHSGLVFVGSGNINNIPQGGEFLINAGRTQDVTATYTVKNIENYKSLFTLENSIIFKNSKTEQVTIDLIERFPAHQKDWEIRQKSHPYEKIDARTVKFLITIPANSTETVSYTTDLER